MEKFNFDFLKAGINEGRFETVAKAVPAKKGKICVQLEK